MYSNKNNGKKLKQKTVEQCRVREGTPMDGAGSMVGRICGKGVSIWNMGRVYQGLGAKPHEPG